MLEIILVVSQVEYDNRTEDASIIQSCSKKAFSQKFSCTITVKKTNHFLFEKYLMFRPRLYIFIKYQYGHINI